MTAFARAKIGFGAGSFCDGKKAPLSKKTLIAERIARIIIRRIYVLFDVDIFLMILFLSSQI